MTTESNASSSSKAAREKTSAQASSPSAGGKKQTISPAERWLLIRENAYIRAQKRGFVGGNPYEDWLEAEEDIDARYATDFDGVFTPTDPAEITKQFKSVLAVYGLGHLTVDELLDKHRDGMKKLAAFNRELVNSTSKLANRQSVLVQGAIKEAVNTLQTVAQGRVNTDGVIKQAELSMKALENALSHVKALTESMTGISSTRQKKDDDKT